jgi:hypothetical protein
MMDVEMKRRKKFGAEGVLFFTSLFEIPPKGPCGRV